jgi:hypothetical protein
MTDEYDSVFADLTRQMVKGVSDLFALDQGEILAAFPKVTLPFGTEDIEFWAQKQPDRSIKGRTFSRKRQEGLSEAYKLKLYELFNSFVRDAKKISQYPWQHADELNAFMRQYQQDLAEEVLLGSNGDIDGDGTLDINLGGFPTYGIADYVDSNGVVGVAANRPNITSVVATSGDYKGSTANLSADLIAQAIAMRMGQFTGDLGWIIPRGLEPMLWTMFSSLWKTGGDFVRQIGNMFIIPESLTGLPTAVTGVFNHYLVDMSSIEIYKVDPQQEVFYNPLDKNWYWDLRASVTPKFNMRYGKGAATTGTSYCKGVVPVISADYAD